VPTSEVARTGNHSLLVWANAAGTSKSNHVLAQKQLNATGIDGKVRLELYSLIDIATADSAQTGPEFSIQNTREIAPGVFRTATAGIQYVANPHVPPTWQVWREHEPGMAGWTPFHIGRLTPGFWYRFSLTADFDTNRYIRLVIDGPDASQELDLSPHAIAQEEKFAESALWLTLEGENLWSNCGDAGAFSSRIFYDHVHVKSFFAPPILSPGRE
jgi:hypothetical protein